MSKLNLCLLFSLFFVASLPAQEGYQRHRWGSTFDDVVAIEGRLSVDSQIGGFVGLSSALAALYGDYLQGRIRDPLTIGNRNITRYSLRSEIGRSVQPTTFWFDERTLVAVELSGFNDPILPLLVERHGRTARVDVTEQTPRSLGSIHRGFIREAAAWRSGDRIVIWVRDSVPRGESGFETLTYMDRGWFEVIAAQLMRDQRERERRVPDALRLD